VRINNQYIHHLSTDERDRVGFARALVLPGCVSDFFFSPRVRHPPAPALSQNVAWESGT
jgi:hypothetical protein